MNNNISSPTPTSPIDEIVKLILNTGDIDTQNAALFTVSKSIRDIRNDRKQQLLKNVEIANEEIKHLEVSVKEIADTMSEIPAI